MLGKRGRKWQVLGEGRPFKRRARPRGFGFRPRFRPRGRFVYQRPEEREVKFFNSDQDDASIASGGTVVGSLNLVPAGTGESQRLGRKVFVKQVQARFAITLATTTAATGDVIRVLVVLDKQANGANPVVTDVVETSDYKAFNNLANKGRFRTLFDRSYSINASGFAGDGTTNGGGPTVIHDAFYRKVNIPIEFDSTAGAITEVKSNNLVVLTFAKVGAICVLDARFRIRFIDG